MKIYTFLIITGMLMMTAYFSTGKEPSADNIYKFSAKTIDGVNQSLSDYKGKVVLIVNVASKCGFTKQYKELEEIYLKYKDRGFVILGFPCNQFSNQEPGTNAEIKQFCTLNYNVTFPMFEKIEVNGDNAHPLYKYLTNSKPGFLGTKSIKWNFTKFLIDKKGNIYDRYASQTTPASLTKDIEKLLK